MRDLAAQRGEDAPAEQLDLARASSTSSSSTANSSPPSRATESTARTQPTSRAATVLSSSSPSAWPNRSLTALKPSRSRNSTAIGAPGAAARGRPPARRGRGTAPGWAGRSGSRGGPGDPSRRPGAAARTPPRRRWRASRARACRRRSRTRARLTTGETSQSVRLPVRTRAPISLAVGASSRSSTPLITAARAWVRSSRSQLVARLHHLRGRGGLEQRAEAPAVLGAARQRAGGHQDRDQRYGEQHARPRRQPPHDDRGEVAQAVDGDEHAHRGQRAALPRSRRAAGCRSSSATETAEMM